MPKARPGSRTALSLALAFGLAAEPLVARSAEPPPPKESRVAFVLDRGESPFWLALPERRSDVVLFRGTVGKHTELGRVPFRAGAADASDRSTDRVVQPRPPGLDAVRTLALGVDLLDVADAKRFENRLGRWRLEAMVADATPADEDPARAQRQSRDREVGMRLRAEGLAQRLRANVGVSRSSGPAFGSPADELDAPGTESEHLEVAFDLIRNHPVSRERATSLTVTARRSSLVSTGRDGSAFPDTDSLFANAAAGEGVAAVALADWQAPNRKWQAARDLVEEIASANIRWSIFPWLLEAPSHPRWGAAIDHGFHRFRPFRNRAGGDGRVGVEDVQSIGATAWFGASSFTYRRSVCLAGDEEDRRSHEVSGVLRPLPSLGVQAYATRAKRPGRVEISALETRDVGGGVDWQVAPGWSLWTGLESSLYDCGPGCEGLHRSIDAQLSRHLDLGIRGQKVPAKVFAGGSQQRVANAAASTAALDDSYWSVGAGVSVTF